MTSIYSRFPKVDIILSNICQKFIKIIIFFFIIFLFSNFMNFYFWFIILVLQTMLLLVFKQSATKSAFNGII